MSDFKGYWKNYEDENYVLGSEEYCAQQAWKHQQAKIEKLENELSTTKQVLGNVIDMEVAKVDDLKTQLNNMEACYIQMKKDKAELLGVISDALEAFNDGEFNYCQKQLEMHAKPLRGDCE